MQTNPTRSSRGVCISLIDDSSAETIRPRDHPKRHHPSDIGCVDTLSRASAADVAPDPSGRLAPLVRLISLQTQVPPCDLEGKVPDEMVGPALGEIYHSRTNRCRNKQFSPVRWWEVEISVCPRFEKR
jgi:hypothetical protein